MRNFRFCLVAVVTVFALTICVYGLVRKPPMQDPGDDIIIKGGSLEIECGKNHGNDCLGSPDAYGKYKHKKNNSHILRVTVTDNTGAILYNSAFDKDHQPAIKINYK
jgi:hypothetical protein